VISPRGSKELRCRSFGRMLPIMSFELCILSLGGEGGARADIIDCEGEGIVNGEGVVGYDRLICDASNNAASGWEDE